MEEIKAYKTSNEAMFESREEAEKYEREYEVQEYLKDFFNQLIYPEMDDYDFAETIIENKDNILDVLKQI